MFLLPISGNRTPIALGAGEWLGRGGRFSPDGGLLAFGSNRSRDRIREALGLFVEDAETAEIEEDVRMPAAVKGAVRNAQRMRQRLEAARVRVSAAEERAVRYLRKTMKLGHRDAGSILGLSHQRVHQLEQKKGRLVGAEPSDPQ